MLKFGRMRLKPNLTTRSSKSNSILFSYLLCTEKNTQSHIQNGDGCKKKPVIVFKKQKRKMARQT